ncbi:cytochrome b-c1 complex subunit 9 isoform X2 [Neodiprion lecontei]|uniref:Cytochrome b-c1 complex subunit 9 isoform X2 n=1 Tax=Neodiprion lecontei TaxID=441921 RepID=A0A6J0BTR5_NEOLC|nr:cytochrome b-c1 complex subunit 9 isoform X2 [Neodiprion lecontei]
MRVEPMANLPRITCRLFCARDLRKIKMAGIASTVYNVICRRSSTFALAIIAGTFVFERTFDTISNQIFDSYNKGKQWKDIKHKYEKE